MRVPFLLALLVVVPATAGAAFAAKKVPNKQALEKAAKKACITGDSRKGIDILGDLFVETNDPTYIYNQGRCFEQNHHWEDAIDRFREYLRKVPDLAADDKGDLEKHIADCKAQIAEQIVPQPAPAAPAPTAPAPVAPPTALEVQLAPPPPAAAAAVALLPAPAPSGDGSGLRTAGMVVAMVGLGGIATGVALALKTLNLTDQLNKPDGYDRGVAETNKTYRTWGWVSYGVGAAALVTGATLYVLGWRSGKSSGDAARLSLVPTLAPGGTALYVQGAY